VLLANRASEFCQPKPSAFSKLGFMITHEFEPKADEPEEDPLDAYMDGIQKDAVVQEAVTIE